MLIPNAANCAEIARRLSAAAPDGLEVRNAHREHAILAVQGPFSDETLGGVGLPTGHDYMAFDTATWQDVQVTVCRTGYTGERGYELVVPWTDAGRLWDALLSAGQPHGILPCGLGSRDTLRTEMGYPLHGQDLSLDITPVQAGAAWAVGWDKPASGGASPCSPNVRPVLPDGCVESARWVAGSRARACVCQQTVSRLGLSLRVRSRRLCAPASGLRCCRQSLPWVPWCQSTSEGGPRSSRSSSRRSCSRRLANDSRSVLIPPRRPPTAGPLPGGVARREARRCRRRG